nr:MAG TPA: hypothetical protein [Caudoviricetes sp.]
MEWLYSCSFFYAFYEILKCETIPYSNYLVYLHSNY